MELNINIKVDSLLVNGKALDWGHINDLAQGWKKELIELTLLSERREYLRNNPETKSNGFYVRGKVCFKSETFEDIRVPRTRDSRFQSDLLPHRKRSHEDLEQVIQALFTFGLGAEKIQRVMEALSGAGYSRSAICNIARASKEAVEEWKSRELQEHYVAIFLDAFFFRIKSDLGPITKPVYVVMGIRPDGKYEILGYYILGNGEGAGDWARVLTDLKERGVRRIDLCVGDGLKGLDETVEAHFPMARFQYCVVHAVRTSLNYVRSGAKRHVADALKAIYRASSKEEAIIGLRCLRENYGGVYPKIVAFWSERFDQLTAFLDFPLPLHKKLYSTNIIERLHKETKRRLKVFEYFQSDVSAENILYRLFTLRNENYSGRGIPNWWDCMNKDGTFKVARVA